jgi:hypothetical protein
MKPVRISEPDTPIYTYEEQQVLRLLNTGLNEHQIARTLRRQFEAVVDDIYEIRKKESIIMGKLTNQQRAAIYAASKDGVPQKDLAQQYGVSVQAISQLCAKLAKTEQEIMQPAAEDKPKPGIINPEFDAAVDEMIAESKAADAEPETEARDESEPLPPVVRRAVDGHLTFIADRIEALQYRISEIEIEIEEYRKDASRLEEWKEQQKWR